MLCRAKKRERGQFCLHKIVLHCNELLKKKLLCRSSRAEKRECVRFSLHTNIIAVCCTDDNDDDKYDFDDDNERYDDDESSGGYTITPFVVSGSVT